MLMFISKGIPYNTGKEDSIFKVWHNGNVISLTNNQKIIWKFLYGEVKTYNDLMKLIYKLFNNGIVISKQVLIQTLTQLKSLGLIAYLDNTNEKEGEFVLLFKNKIKPLKDIENNSCFETELYDFIKNNEDISVADFISTIDEKEYNDLTNGFDEGYLRYIYSSVHSKITLETVKSFIKNGNCYIA